MTKKKNKNNQKTSLQIFLEKINNEKLAILRATKNEREINDLLREANNYLTNYLTASEDEKIRSIINEHLEFQDEVLEFDVEQDYYEILEVEENASSEEIKKACKKLCFKWHPDKNNDSEESKKKFQEIQNAADILLSNLLGTVEEAIGRKRVLLEEVEKVKEKNIEVAVEEEMISELNDTLWVPYENFTDKFDSLSTEEEINALYFKILEDIEKKRRNKNNLSGLRTNSIKRIENLLKENQMGLEDIDKKEYGKLFLAFGSNHDCLILANYKQHINNCLMKISDIQVFENRLVELIKSEQKKLKKIKEQIVKEIKKEIFPFKLEEEMEEKTRSEALQEIKEALNPQGQLAVQVNELGVIFSSTGFCSCFGYQTYKEHINKHLKEIIQIINFKNQIISSINNKREEKRKSRNQRKKIRRQLDNFLEKTIASELNKIEKIEEIDLLIEKAETFLANGLYINEEKREIQAAKSKLESKKEALKSRSQAGEEKDKMIFQLQNSLKKVSEESQVLVGKVKSLEANREVVQGEVGRLQHEFKEEKSKNTRLQKQLEFKQKELESKEKENISIQQKLKNQNAELDMLKAKVSTQEKLIDRYLQKQKNEVAELEQQLSSLRIQDIEMEAKTQQANFPPFGKK
ncbi:11786_t:CDS:2 [Entrophospora sp. SA101]|nr:11786_t:CDS:2 [Entrophospora sp. SA101]CAJ0912278.1 9074_t:CDS:2 [Entrophospora sp. SA101]